MPDSFREMLDKINEARANITNPQLVHRLSAGGKDAAAMAAVRDEHERLVRAMPQEESHWTPSCEFRDSLNRRLHSSDGPVQLGPQNP